MRLNKSLVLALCAACVPALYAADVTPKQITWTFDRLDKVGGAAVKVEGHPKVIETPVGKAIEFDGVSDAIWIAQHPLAGAATFTFEAIFRPDGGGEEQRWFHLAERDSRTGLLASPGQDANARFLFELRVIDNTKWCLDAFVNGPGYNKALLFREKAYPLGRWYHVADTYDGHAFRSYVNGELQGEAEIAFTPQGPGETSVGARINRVNYFHGAVAKARFTPKALPVSEFMKLPTRK